MNTQLNAFDRVAGFYDIAKRIVFGRAIYESKTHFIKEGYVGRRILIVGGGSGETLPLLLRVNPACHVWFLDASSQMLELARRRMKAGRKENITFIHSTKDHLPEGLLFDTVITDFFLDLFSETEVARMAHLFTSRLQPEGVWLAADFVDGGKPWQKLMLWAMYRFFAATCKIEATGLPSWQLQIRSAGMREVATRSSFGGFIVSTVYSKKNSF